jgi:hypothetical protein
MEMMTTIITTPTTDHSSHIQDDDFGLCAWQERHPEVRALIVAQLRADPDLQVKGQDR